MKRLETMREQVRTVVERWNWQGNRDKEKVAKLAALDVETATDADVARIIGNDAWCLAETCHECLSRNWDMIELGAGDEAVEICIDCLRKALALLEAPKE